METIIIDDELKAIKLLEFHLQRDFNTFNIIGKYTNSEEGLRAVLAQEPKVLFLDINMPKISGIDLLKEIAHLNTYVIFLTAHSEYAIDAIRLDAFDYLLKPISYIELNRIKEKIEKAVLNGAEDSSPKKIKFRINNNAFIYELDDIIYTRSEGNYTTIFSINRKPLTLSKNLKKIQNEYLNTRPFFKPHQSYLVNLNHVVSYSNNDITLTNGINVPLSVRRQKAFLETI